MKLDSPQMNLILRACNKASRSLIRDFGKLKTSSFCSLVILFHQLIKEQKKY